jgi:hypothetical protein
MNNYIRDFMRDLREAEILEKCPREITLSPVWFCVYTAFMVACGFAVGILTTYVFPHA